MTHFTRAVVVLAVLLLPTTFSLAQTSADVSARQAELEAQLRQIEAEIAKQTSQLQSKQKETASIQRDIDILTGQINGAKLKIKAKQIQIQQLGSDIGKKQTVITSLTDRLTKEQASLSELLRKYRELDDVTLAEVALAEENLTEVFTDVTAFNSIQGSLHKSFTVVRETKEKTETEKNQLQARRNAELDAQKVIEAEKRKIEQFEKEKQVLLKSSKGQEEAYKIILANRQKQKETILNALFKLRGSTSISFGQALEHAKFVSQKTGIRPAFLLAILTQETNLGENVGTCNRPGDPPEKHWKEIMKPSRDQAPYLEITKELGLDPETQPLSCPWGGGWGGAMGPAQFIPSTWAIYKTKIANITGNNPPNPWSPRDAFAASGIYLTELGAAGGNYTAERTAALKYYAGGNWNKPSNAFYGNSVMKIAADYQAQIDVLQQN